MEMRLHYISRQLTNACLDAYSVRKVPRVYFKITNYLIEGVREQLFEAIRASLSIDAVAWRIIEHVIKHCTGGRGTNIDISVLHTLSKQLNALIKETLEAIECIPD